ncbi:MAG TPA: hypothetical protein PLF73_05595 [Luteimonas sp.]|nr:hypothetical protein [Luteimonas sp.]
MNQDAREVKFQTLIGLANEHHEQIRSVRDDAENGLLEKLQLAEKLIDTVQQCDDLLQEASMDEGYQRLSYNESIARLRNVLRPMASDWKQKIDRLLEKAGSDPFYSQHRDRERNPVLEIFWVGIENHRTLDTGEYSEDELDLADKLVSASWFKPDSWLNSFRETEPVIGQNIHRLPQHIKIRLEETYRSFAFGHFFSVLAMTRSIMEIAIKDRAAEFGIELTKPNPRGLGLWGKGLKDLVEDLSDTLSELRFPMERIRDNGDEAMHNIDRKSKVYDELSRRQRALESIVDLRVVLERLYR